MTGHLSVHRAYCELYELLNLLLISLSDFHLFAIIHRYTDAVDFWATSYKWRVNMGSLANEMLRGAESIFNIEPLYELSFLWIM